MTVLQIHEKIEIKGGAEVYVHQLTALLPHFGVNTFWLGLMKDESGYRLIDHEIGEIFLSKTIEELNDYLIQFVAEKKIDLINIHNLFDEVLVRLLLRLRPVIKSVHSPVMVCPGRDKFWRFSEQPCTIKYGLHCFYHIYKEGCSNRHPKRVKKAWDYVQFEAKEAAYKYKKIIVMSDYMRDGLLECGVPESQIMVNPYFTPVVSEEPVNSSPIQKRLLFVGRLVSSKGAHLMISSLAGLLKESPNVYLDIIGDGLMKEELVDQVEMLGLQHKIFFHNWKAQSDIDKMIRQAYLVLFPSVYPEAFGIVGIEAMMRSKPVIAFNVGGVGTWLKNGVNGYLVDNKNLEEFKERTAYLLNNISAHSDMSESARKLVMTRFTPEIHINNIIEIYSDAISRWRMEVQENRK